MLKAGGTVRNYGFLVNNIGSIGTKAAPVSDPFAAGIVQVAPLDPALAPLTDVYFRGYDQNYPDLWRYNEWKREFDQFVANGNLPSLSLVRISHDHMGSFGTALGGVNTPETQQADCDLALGRLVEAVANSRYAADTLIIVTEDDVQDGPDHVDSHRGTAYVVGPYVKQGAVVSTRYNQVNVLRTIEDILGTRAHQPEHRLPAADGRCVRHPVRPADGPTPPRRRPCWRRRRWRSRRTGSGVEVRRRADDHAAARRRVLGRGHGRLRLLRSRPGAAGAVQPGAVDRPDGQQAVSGPARPDDFRDERQPLIAAGGRHGNRLLRLFMAAADLRHRSAPLVNSV